MPKEIKKDCRNLPDCGHGEENLVVNRSCWLWVTLLLLVRFDSFGVAASFSTAERFFTTMKIHTIACVHSKETKQFYF